jgi:hypothetical protein
MRQATTAKVRLDAGKAARFSASAQSTGGFDALRSPQSAVLPLLDTPEGAMLVHNHRESGECRFESILVAQPAVLCTVGAHTAQARGNGLAHFRGISGPVFQAYRRPWICPPPGGSEISPP